MANLPCGRAVPDQPRGAAGHQRPGHAQILGQEPFLQPGWGQAGFGIPHGMPEGGIQGFSEKLRNVPVGQESLGSLYLTIRYGAS